MTAEIINLRQARKARARAAKDAQASESRAKFGLSKAERHQLAMETDRRVRHLDNARIDRPGPVPDGDNEPPTGGAA